MGKGGTVKLAVVWEMMSQCAKGYERRETDHYWQIRYDGRLYPNFPTGAHDKKKEIEFGHVRRMTKFFGIKNCANEMIPGLFR